MRSSKAGRSDIVISDAGLCGCSCRPLVQVLTRGRSNDHDCLCHLGRGTFQLSRHMLINLVSDIQDFVVRGATVELIQEQVCSDST